MVGFSCVHCTRIFEQPSPGDGCMPHHLDALLGTPCQGTGDPILFLA